MPFKSKDRGKEDSSEKPAQTPVCVFIDDLNVLEQLAPSPQASRRLMHGLLADLYAHADAGEDTRKIAASPSLVSPSVQPGATAPSSLVSLIALGPTSSSSSSSSSSIEEEEEPTLTEVSKTRADVSVTVLPLASGYSQDVHGTVHITALQSRTAGAGSSATAQRPMQMQMQRQRWLLEEARSFKLVRPGTVVSHCLAPSRGV
jgi:hypothetical protein